MGITCTPAARSSSSARSTSAVTSPSVVRVSSMSVRTPLMPRLDAAGQLASGFMPRQPFSFVLGIEQQARASGLPRGPALLAERKSSDCTPLLEVLAVPGGQLPVST